MKNLKYYTTLSLIFFVANSCQKNDDKLDVYSNKVEFKGIINDKQEVWRQPDYNPQQGVASSISTSVKPFDTLQYSFQLFSPYNRLSLIHSKRFHKKDFYSEFSPGTYKIGEDYRLVFTINRRTYFSGENDTDFIQLVSARKIHNKSILCSYTFECNLNDEKGVFYSRIKNGSLTVVFQDFADYTWQ